MSFFRVGAVILLGLAALPAVTSSADEPTPNTEQRLAQLEAELAELRGRVGDGPAAAIDDDQGSAITSSANAAEIMFLPPILPPPEEPKYPTVAVHGFFQADAGWFHQDARNIASVGDVQDGANIRRARLSAGGAVAENVSYFMEFDFSFPGRPSFMDVYLDIDDFVGPANMRLGYWRQPIGMDILTSVKDLTFLERALPFALLPFRQIGVGLHDEYDDGGGTWAVSAIRFPSDFYGSNIGDNGGYGVVGRVSYLPWDAPNDRSLLHVGASYAFADPSNDAVQFLSQPEFNVSETGAAALVPIGVPDAVPPFVDTNPIATNNFHVVGLEGAVLLNAFHFQSELIYASVDQIANTDVSFWGAYAQAGYYLTGEVREYNHANGVFGRIDPRTDFLRCTGIGAWEIAARWSTLDLDDRNIDGGRLTDLTLGLNWYLNRNAKFQFNWIHAYLTDPLEGKSDADIAAVRAQVDF